MEEQAKFDVAKAIEQLADRVSTIEQNMKNLEAMDNTVTTQLEQAIQDDRLNIYALKTAVQDLWNRVGPVDAELIDPVLNMVGYSFRAVLTPKQDAMVAGVNSVGKPGVALEVSDGTTTSVVARIVYDHRHQKMVLQTGTGV